MDVRLVCVLGLALATPVMASPVVITITGVTGEIRIGEGPIFGHSSYQVVPPGAPFVLTYTFDDEKGRQTIAATQGDVITESKTETANDVSPGASAVLQIGSAVWEFGASTRAQVALSTASGSKGEQVMYATRSGGNRVSANITPGKGGYWPKNGDWRASFLTTSIEGSSAVFSADNDRVSGKGTLVPESISVQGVDVDGQWLRTVSQNATTPTATGEPRWQLAHASPKGGYIVEEVERIVLGTAPDGSAVTPSLRKYWQAWQVPSGANEPSHKADGFPSPEPAGSKGEEKVTTTARFYEGLTLPPSFAPGNSPYATGRLSSTANPHVSTLNATLPVTETVTLHF